MRNNAMNAERTNVAGTECLNASYAELAEYLRGRSRERGAGTLAVDFTNTHIVAMRRTDPAFARSLEAFDLFVPDSQVLWFTIRLLGGTMEERVYGPTFMRRCVLGSPAPCRHYFLGGSRDCLARLEARFRAADPRILVVGRHHGYFGPEDEAAVVADINACDPDFIWVGLGTPKQQEWIARNRPKIRRGALLAVGFAFDVNAGTKEDAPAWLQKLGLTWLHRLLSEPRRLWKRYLLYNSLFVWFVGQQVLCGPPRPAGTPATPS